MQFRLENPEYLLGLVLIAALFILMLWKARRLPASFSLRRLITTTAAMLMCVFGLSRPQAGHQMMDNGASGAPVVIAIDISRSMLAEDVSPSRLRFAVSFATRVLEHLSSPRIAIFAFSTDGYFAMPFTSDVGAASELLSTLEPTLNSNQGTDLSQSLTTLFQKLSFMEEKAQKRGIGWSSPQIILFSDGETHEALNPEVARYFRKARLPIFAVGVGTQEGTHIAVPMIDRLPGSTTVMTGKAVRTRLTPAPLKAIAELTGGDYFAASFPEMDRLISQLSRSLELRKLVVTFQTDYELYPILFAVALLLMSLEFALGRWHYAIRSVFLAVAASSLVLTHVAEAESPETPAFRSLDEQSDSSVDDETMSVRLYNQGIEHLKAKRLEQAAERFQESIFLASNKVVKKKALYNLANTMMRMADPAQAIQLYQEAYDLQTGDTEFDKETNKNISENLILATRLEKQIQQLMANKKRQQGASDGQSKADTRDQGGPERFYQAQQFTESEKKRIFDLVASEEQEVVRRLRESKNEKKSSAKESGKPW